MSPGIRVAQEGAQGWFQRQPSATAVGAVVLLSPAGRRGRVPGQRDAVRGSGSAEEAPPKGCSG